MKPEIQAAIEAAAFMNPPNQSGTWETAATGFLANAEDLILACAAGDLQRANRIQRDIRIKQKVLLDLLVGELEYRPIKVHCGDCGKTWKGATPIEDAIASYCRPYDDEISPGFRHRDDMLTITFDLEAIQEIRQDEEDYEPPDHLKFVPRGFDDTPPDIYEEIYPYRK
jgi:hypothetical protein